MRAIATLVEQIIARYSKNRSNGDTSMKFGTYTLQMPLFLKIPLAMQNSKMAAPKIQDVRPKMCFLLYKSKCIDFKPHKCIKVEYKVGYCGYFSTSLYPLRFLRYSILYIAYCIYTVYCIWHISKESFIL